MRVVEGKSRMWVKWHCNARNTILAHSFVLLPVSCACSHKLSLILTSAAGPYNTPSGRNETCQTERGPDIYSCLHQCYWLMFFFSYTRFSTISNKEGKISRPVTPNSGKLSVRRNLMALQNGTQVMSDELKNTINTAMESISTPPIILNCG